MVSCLGGCSKYKQIKITGGRIDNITMVSLRTINLALVVGIDNPAGKLDVREADGELFHFGKVIGKVTLAPMALLPRRTAEYHVKAHLELASGLKLMDILSLAAPGKIEEMIVDLSFTGKAGGVVIRRNINDVPLKKLLEKTINEKI